MGCFQMQVLRKPNEILSCYREKTSYMEMKEFWDAVAGAEEETVGAGERPKARYPAYNHRELLWWFGKNGWSDIMLATAPNKRVNRMFNNIIKHAQKSISAENGEGEGKCSPRLLSVFILRPYDKYSSKLQRAIKRALFRIHHGRHLLNEENEVPRWVPYIPLTDQQILTLAADLKRFPNDEIDKLKKLVIDNYMESTILFDWKFQSIDYISIVDKECRSNAGLSKKYSCRHRERMEYLYDKYYTGSLSERASVSDYPGCSIVFCNLFNRLLGRSRDRFDTTASEFPLAIQNSPYTNIPNGNQDNNNSMEHEDQLDSMDNLPFVRHDSSTSTEILNSPALSRHDSSISTATSYNSARSSSLSDISIMYDST